MVIDQLATLDLTTMLDKYYEEICTYQLDAISQTRADLYNEIDNINKDSHLKCYFELLEFRYAVLRKDINIANELVSHIPIPKETAYKQLHYFYYFFKGLHAVSMGKYSEARPCFEKAENLIAYITEDFAIAEHHFIMSEYYYHIKQPLLAIRLALKAKKKYSQNLQYRIKQAYCENIIALSSLSLNQFDIAEELFLSALGMLQDHPGTELNLLVRFNIGLLYSEKNLSQASIRHLLKVYKKKFYLHKATFLLAREYFKIGEKNRAEELINEGLAYCKEYQYEEYKHHLTFLQIFNKKTELNELELQIKEGFSYFYKEELYGHIEDYAEKVALYFNNSEYFQKSSYYFKMAYDAKQKQLEKGEFK